MKAHPTRIESLKVKNFRALKNVEIKDITPLTVLLGPNGCGKSTVFDVFAFLSECFESGLKGAWERRGKAKELKSRGGQGAVAIEITYRESPKAPLMEYRLEINEKGGSPYIKTEQICQRADASGEAKVILENKNGIAKYALSGEPGWHKIALSARDILAAGLLGQLKNFPHAITLREFVRGWHLPHFLPNNTRETSEAGPQKHLNNTGSNLANVIRHLTEKHPKSLETIYDKLRHWVPKLQSLDASMSRNDLLSLQLKDATFDSPIMVDFVSDGTLNLLAYLVLLNHPNPPPFILLDNPENCLHPRLLWLLAEECRGATAAQVIVATHSPFFLDALRPKEVRVLWRDEKGYAQCHPPNSDDKIKTMMDNGSLMGYLWMEGDFEVGDPLTRDGGMSPRLASNY